MLQPLGFGTRTRVVAVTVIASLLGASVLLGAFEALGHGIVGIAAGIAGGTVVAIVVANLLGRWVFAPLRDLEQRRPPDPRGAGPRPTDPEAIVASLLRSLEDQDKAVEAERTRAERASTELSDAVAHERSRGDALAGRLDEHEQRLEGMRRLLLLHELVLDPILGQLGRAIERVISIDSQIHAARPLLRVARAAVLWAEEAVETLKRLDEPEGPTREPFSLRDEIGTVARAMSLGLGREVSMRFGGDFPAQGTTDRTRLRLATLAVGHWISRRDPDGEIVLEASFVEGANSHKSRLQLVLDTRSPQVSALHPADGAAHPDVLTLASIVRPCGGEMLVSPEPNRLGFTLEATRQKRMSGHTLYGVGSLSERSVLVIDPRTRGRALLCEQLVAWRMTPTAAADIPAALEALELAERAKKPFEVVIVCPRPPGMRSDGTPPELAEMSRHMAFRQKKVLSLESFETLTAALSEPIAALEPHRMGRPAPPLELLEALTMMLAPKPGSRPALSGKTRAGGALSVLVVEDNAVNQALLAKMLERRGHTVVLTANGADAVDRLQESPGGFDIVLMDIQMPVMDGYEATAVVRMREAQDGLPRIPIIAVTAHAMSGERDKCLEAGMDAYLAKPVSEAELMALIDETVRRIRTSEPASRETTPTSDVFDARRVLEFAAGDQAFLRTLVEIFSETTPKQVAAIEAGVQHRDAGALMRAAHQLKGSVGNFAAERARKLAGELEDLARKKDFETATTLVAPLKVELEALREGLQRLV
ncbi:MAG: response regulator [Deltaproteobacteria bacterium]|nr:response regulator [Deltaproteobacteria bacterium]